MYCGHIEMHNVLVNMYCVHYYMYSFVLKGNPMFDFVSTLDEPARDTVTESSYSPATVDEALAIAYGYNTTPPSQHHLLALIEHYGITESVSQSLTAEKVPF